MKTLRAEEVMASDVFSVSPDLSLLDLERELAARAFPLRGVGVRARVS